MRLADLNPQRPRVTLIGTLPPIKGLSPYCSGLASALAEETQLEFIGFRSLYPSFLYPGGTQTDLRTDAVDTLPGARVRTMLTYYNPFSWIWAGLTFEGEVLHAQWWSYVLAAPYAVILTLAKLRKRRLVITAHNVIPHEGSKLSQVLNRVILRLADRIIVHTPSNRDVLVEKYRFAPERVSVIPHGVLNPAPRAGMSQREAREALGIPANSKVVLYFGNIRGYKGVGVLIEAMQKVLARIPDAFLVIAGQPWKSSLEYEEQIVRCRLEDHSLVRFAFVPPGDVESYFASSDILALPYEFFDSQSGVAALGLSFGVPMVVTDVGGLPEMAADPRAIVPPGDVDGLARALEMILGDDALRSALAARTIEKAADYQWDDIARSTVEVYDQVLRVHPSTLLG